MAKRRQRQQYGIDFKNLTASPEVHERLLHFQTVTMRARSASDAIDYLLVLANLVDLEGHEDARRVWLAESDPAST